MSDNLFALILSRRSHYRFTSQAVDDETVEQLVRAASHAPSSRDAQPWAFLVVRDRERMAQLLADRRQMKDPPHHVWPAEDVLAPHAVSVETPAPPPALIVVCGDRAVLDDEAGLALSCACAAENLLLAAHGLGLGAGWVFCYGDPEREARVRAILAAPETVRPVCLILIGHPGEAVLLPKNVRSAETLIHRETW